MNKTIIINISGTIFHVEEEAYEKLKVYMTDVKNYFSKSEDSFEIISDIENRIAELFLEIIRAEEKEVIISKDVEKVIRTMGQPEQFEKEMSDEDIFTDFIEIQKIKLQEEFVQVLQLILISIQFGLDYY
jgi:hypothetical protein